MNETTTLIQAARAAAEAFLAVLDGADVPVKPTADNPAQPATIGEPIEYDPLTDPVPLPQDPKGTRPEFLMSHLTYLGAIGRINATEGRGATSAEVTQYAKKAGYVDGRVVNGWNSRKGSPRSIESIGGARYLNAQGHTWVHQNAAELGITLKGDLTPLPIPHPRTGADNEDR